MDDVWNPNAETWAEYDQRMYAEADEDEWFGDLDGWEEEAGDCCWACGEDLGPNEIEVRRWCEEDNW